MSLKYIFIISKRLFALCEKMQTNKAHTVATAQLAETL